MIILVTIIVMILMVVGTIVMHEIANWIEDRNTPPEVKMHDKMVDRKIKEMFFGKK